MKKLLYVKFYKLITVVPRQHGQVPVEDEPLQPSRARQVRPHRAHPLARSPRPQVRPRPLRGRREKLPPNEVLNKTTFSSKVMRIFQINAKFFIDPFFVIYLIFYSYIRIFLCILLFA